MTTYTKENAIRVAQDRAMSTRQCYYVVCLNGEWFADRDPVQPGGTTFYVVDKYGIIYERMGDK